MEREVVFDDLPKGHGSASRPTFGLAPGSEEVKANDTELRIRIEEARNFEEVTLNETGIGITNDKVSAGSAGCGLVDSKP